MAPEPSRSALSRTIPARPMTRVFPSTTAMPGFRRYFSPASTRRRSSGRGWSRSIASWPAISASIPTRSRPRRARDPAGKPCPKTLSPLAARLRGPTSSATSRRSWAMGEPSCSARSWVETGHADDVQLKGAGRRRSRAAGTGEPRSDPVLREVLVSRGLAALGVPTTRALAAVTTGGPRCATRAPGAVLTRVAASHIRVGAFQFFARAETARACDTLATYVIERQYYPEACGPPNPYAGAADLERRRRPAGWSWIAPLGSPLGFVHGAMKTTDISVSGETIDYGPCAFLDAYDPATVF